MTSAERFWAKVNKSGKTMPHMESCCWEWTGFIWKSGYGCFSVTHRISHRAHRVSYEMTNGAIPQDAVIMHRCDNPSCVRPDHLVQGSSKDNTQDMLKKGRHTSPKGEDHGNALLSEELVLRIRALHATRTLTLAKLAEQCGVSKAAASKVVYRQTWRHI